jgi:hypothetical protein
MNSGALFIPELLITVPLTVNRENWEFAKEVNKAFWQCGGQTVIFQNITAV